MGSIAFAAWVLTVALSYFLLGGRLEALVEGYDTARLSALPLWIMGVAVSMSCLLTFRWAARAKGKQKGSKPSGRRRFLVGTLGAAGGILASLAAAIGKNSEWYSVTGKNIFLVRPPYKADENRAEWRGSRITEYRRLGRTEARVSDISLGTGSSTGGRLTTEVAREAIERGMSYFDTAPDYAATGSEQLLGQAMKGLRDRIFLATKFCTPNGHLGPGASVQEYMEVVDGSLGRLQTDHVDLVHIHSCNSIERLMDENVHEAFDRLKDQGKVRFLGVSTHTPNLEEVANAAIDSNRFDVMMLAYHYGAWPNIGDIIDRAAAQDIGIVAMKTLRGSHHHGISELRDSPDSFTQASFKWVLANPNVSCLVISLWDRDQLDEFFYASGQRPGQADYALLERYDELTRAKQCRPHCGICLDACPEQLAIHDVLRHRMYFENFGAQKEAIRLYASLEKQADVCLSCDAPCSAACPYGIDIPTRTREAHALLSLS